MQPQLCKNCEHLFQGNYCSNCGQKTNTVRLNWHYLQDELKYTFLHINKGFLYTIKELFTRPGDTVREFLEGKRVHHYKPILLLFVLAGINGLLMHYIPVEEFMYQKGNPNPEAVKQLKQGKLFYDWLIKHYALYELMILPLYALCSWLAFKKFGYNYIENIIINCFATSQRLAIGILLFPLQYLLKNTPYFMVVSFLTIVPTFGYSIWMILQLYKKQNSGSVVLRMLLFVFNLTLLFIVLLIIAIIGFVFLVKMGYLDKGLLVAPN